MSNVPHEAAAVQQSRKGGLKVKQARNVYLRTNQQQSLPFTNFKMSVTLHKLQFQDCMTGIT